MKPVLKPIIQNLRYALPEFGKIKIGGKDPKVRKTEGGKEWQAPVKYNHFVITTLERGEDGNFVKDEIIHETLAAKYGDEPTRIPIRLLYNEWFLNFPSAYKCYNGKNLICTGDGENAIRITKDNEEEYPSCPCEHAASDYAGKYPCKKNAVLSCIIEGTERLGGVYKLRTTSNNAINSITASLNWLYIQTHGILAGIPLELVLNTKTTTNPKGGVVTINYVTVEFKAGIAALLQEAREIRQLESGYVNDIKLIESKSTELVREDLDQQTIEPEEFYPEKPEIETKQETITPDGVKVNTSTGEITEEPLKKDFEVKAKAAPVAEPTEDEEDLF